MSESSEEIRRVPDFGKSMRKKNLQLSVGMDSENEQLVRSPPNVTNIYDKDNKSNYFGSLVDSNHNRNRTMRILKKTQSIKQDMQTREERSNKILDLESKIYELESMNTALETTIERIQDELVTSKEVEDDLVAKVQATAETLGYKEERISDLETENMTLQMRISELEDYNMQLRDMAEQNNEYAQMTEKSVKEAEYWRCAAR